MLRDPPVHVNASFGLMGVVGVVVNIVLFIVDIVSDALLAYVLWRQVKYERFLSAFPETWASSRPMSDCECSDNQNL